MFSDVSRTHMARFPKTQERDRAHKLDRHQILCEPFRDERVGMHQQRRVEIRSFDLGCDAEDGGEEDGGGLLDEIGGVDAGVELARGGVEEGEEAG